MKLKHILWPWSRIRELECTLKSETSWVYFFRGHFDETREENKLLKKEFEEATRRADSAYENRDMWFKKAMRWERLLEKALKDREDKDET